MLGSGSATAMMGAALLALLPLAGCDGQRPEASTPPPVASTPPPAATPELMGGPPEHTAPIEAASEPPIEEQAFTSMAPVANPEDMTPDERVQVYGHTYDHPGLAGETRYAGRHHRVHAFVGHGRRASFGLAEHRRLAWRGRWRHDAHGRHKLHAPGAQSGAASSASHESARAPGASDALRASAPAYAGPEAAPSAAVAANAAPSPPSAEPAASNPGWLSIPGAPYVSLPGFGRIASRYVTAAVLLLLAIVLLAIAAGRGHAAGRRRRPARNAVGAGPAFSDARPSEPSPSQGGGVEPFPHREAARLPEPTWS